MGSADKELMTLSKDILCKKIRGLEFELQQADQQLKQQYEENAALKGKMKALEGAATEGRSRNDGADNGAEVKSLRAKLRSSADEISTLKSMLTAAKASPKPFQSSSAGEVEVDRLREELAAQQESRKSAIDAWEAAERKVVEAEERVVEAEKEMQNGLRQMEEEKWDAQKKLKWQVSKTEEAEARIANLQSKLGQKNEELMSLQVNLNSLQINARAADQVERLKTQATIESMRRDQMWRESFYRQSLQQMQGRLESQKVRELKLQRQLNEAQLQLLVFQNHAQKHALPASQNQDLNQVIETTKQHITSLEKKIKRQEDIVHTRAPVNVDMMLPQPAWPGGTQQERQQPFPVSASYPGVGQFPHPSTVPLQQNGYAPNEFQKVNHHGSDEGVAEDSAPDSLDQLITNKRNNGINHVYTPPPRPSQAKSPKAARKQRPSYSNGTDRRRRSKSGPQQGYAALLNNRSPKKKARSPKSKSGYHNAKTPKIKKGGQPPRWKR